MSALEDGVRALLELPRGAVVAVDEGAILVDHETYTRSEGYFEFENLEPVELKGKSKAIEVHRFLGTRVQQQKIHRLHGLRAQLIGVATLALRPCRATAPL